jgi:putative ABC transport system permease protein
MLDNALLAEVLQTWRNLLRRPRYLMLAGLTLALGVAACAAVFSLIQQSLLRPAPFPQPEQLVTIGLDPGDGAHIAAPAIYRSLQDLPGLDSSGIVNAYTREVSVAGAAMPVVGTLLGADRGFLQALQPEIALGRGFSEDEDRPGGERVVVLSHSFWQQHFAGAADVLNRQISIEGLPFTVVGVLPPDFRWPQRFDMLNPLRLPATSEDMDTNQFVVARLAAGTSIDALSAQTRPRFQALLETLRTQLGADAFDFLRRLPLDAKPLQALYSGDNTATLGMFSAAALCVLMIAAFNLVNLVLLRGSLRDHHSAVRAALGASRLRLMVPDLAESVLVGLVGGALGLAMAWAGLRLVQGAMPEPLVQGELGVDPTTSALALTAAVMVALIASLIGGLRKLAATQARELVAGSRSGPGRRTGRIGRALVVAQVSVAVLLLIGASLFMRSLYSMAAVPLGFESTGIVTFSLAPLRGIYTDDAAVRQQTRAILEHLQRLPWVERAAASTHLPTGSRFNMPAQLENGQRIQPQYRPVSDDFFGTFGISMRVGRSFDSQDIAAGEPVCIVNEAFVSQHLQGDPLGQRIAMGRGSDGTSLVDMRIVGVVTDVRQHGPTEAAPAILYAPLEQVPARFWPVLREFGPLNYALRTRTVPADLEAVLRRAVQEVSAQQAIAHVRDMDSVVQQTMEDARLYLILVGIFALLALLLAGVGLYAMLAVNASARMHEYGVRAALGADAPRLLRIVVRDSGKQIGLGLLIGVLGSIALGSTLRAFLFGVGVGDPISLLMVVALIAVVGIVATLGPALRTSRIAPSQALRSE